MNRKICIDCIRFDNCEYNPYVDDEACNLFEKTDADEQRENKQKSNENKN